MKTSARYIFAAESVCDVQNIEIIPIRVDLIDDILAIQTECGLSEWTHEGYVDELTHPDAVLIAARVSGVIAGFLAGRAPASTVSLASQADVYNIGCRAMFKRRGIGTALMVTFLETCERRGVEKVWLDVRQSNETAKAFYKRHGFVKTGTRKSFYSNPPEDADVMCRITGRANAGQTSQGA